MGCLSGGCGSYVSLFGGYNELDKLSGEGVRINFNDGIALGGAIGRRFSKSFRGELEGSFRTNTLDDVSIGAASIDASGHLYTYAGMANLYYDLHQVQFFGYSPYAGVGLGFAVVDGSKILSDIDETEFAHQYIVGTSKQLRPGVTMFSEFRNFNVDLNPDLDMDTYLFGLRFDR